MLSLVKIRKGWCVSLCDTITCSSMLKPVNLLTSLISKSLLKGSNNTKVPFVVNSLEVTVKRSCNDSSMLWRASLFVSDPDSRSERKKGGFDIMKSYCPVNGNVLTSPEIAFNLSAQDEIDKL